MKARKGDAVLIVSMSHDYVIGQPRSARTTAEFGMVASATREGMVKTWHHIGWGDELLSPAATQINYPRRPDQTFILPAAEFDVNALLTAAKAHHWPNHPGQPMPFASVDEARELARPFRKAQESAA